MAKKNLKIPSLNKIKEWIEILYGKTYSDDRLESMRQEYIDKNNQLDDILFYAKRNKNISEYYNNVFSAIQHPRVEIILKPPKRDILYKQILILKDIKDIFPKYQIHEIPQVIDALHHLPMDQLEFGINSVISVIKKIKDRITDTNDTKKISDNLNLIRRINNLNNFGETACITPVIAEEPKSRFKKLLNYLVFVSQELFDKINETFTNEKEKITTLGQVLEHEILGHFKGGDLNPDDRRVNIGYMKEWSGHMKNIHQDLRINTTLMRFSGERPIKSLLPGIVSADTIPIWYGQEVAILDALQNMMQTKGENFYENIEEEPIYEELIEAYKRSYYEITKKEITSENAKQTLDNIDFEKTISNLKTLKSLNDLVLLNLNEDLNFRNIRHTDVDKNNYPEVQEFFKTSENINHKNQIQWVTQSATLYENGLLDDFMYHFLGKTQDNYAKQIIYKERKEGEGEGSSGQEQGQGTAQNKQPSPGDESVDTPLDSDSIPSEEKVDYDEDEYKSAEEDIQNEISEKLDKAERNRKGGRGEGPGMWQQLSDVKDTQLEQAIKESLRMFGHNFMEKIERQTVATTTPPPPGMNIFYEKVKAGKTATPPRGWRRKKTKQKPANGIVLTVIDESGSMSGEDVAAAKTALMDICESYNIGLLNFSISQEIDDAEVNFYHPQQSNRSSFNFRTHNGGTGSFQKILYDFDNILTNPNHKIYKSIARELKKYNREDFELTPKILKEYQDNGLIGCVVITDGEILTDNLAANEMQKITNYVEKFRNSAERENDVPLYYISTTTTCHFPFNPGLNNYAYRIKKRTYEKK